MPTKLFLRNTQLHGLTPSGDTTWYDMDITAGASADTGVVDTVASGTEIQWTKTAGGATFAWISKRVPSGGFTLTQVDIDVWCHESNAQANSGGRFRVFKRAANGTITELGGGPFNDGVEFGTSAASMTWIGNVTDTAFAEDDRILLRLYITNVGTMGGGRTCTVTFNAADGATGDSFLNLAETVTFKAEDQAVSGGTISSTQIFVPTVTTTTAVTGGTIAGTALFAPSIAQTVVGSTISGTVLFSPSVSGVAPNLLVDIEVLEGAIVRVTRTDVEVDTLENYVLSFSEAERDSFTAWDDVRVRFIPHGTGAVRMYALEMRHTPDQEVELPVIALTQLFAPSLAYAVTGGTITSSVTMFAPSVAHEVTTGTISSGNQLFPPTLAYAVTTGTIASAAALYPPAVFPAHAVSTGTIPSGSLLYAPALAYALTTGTISATVLFSPTLAYAVTAGTIPFTVTMFPPLLGTIVTGGFVSGTILYGATVEVEPIVSPPCPVGVRVERYVTGVRIQIHTGVLVVRSVTNLRWRLASYPATTVELARSDRRTTAAVLEPSITRAEVETENTGVNIPCQSYS